MSTRITDQDILVAMKPQPGDTPEKAARRVIELFARRVGRWPLSEDEVRNNVERILQIVKLPVRQIEQP